MNETAAGTPSPTTAPPLGFTVALIGSDGAGKSTVAREVVRRLPFPAEYLYMGVNLEASPVMLPTTRIALAIKRRRGGRSDMTVGQGESAGGGRGPLGSVRRLVRMVNWLAEETYRAAIARRIQRTPAVVVFDRHFFCDYYASAIAPTTRRRSLDTRLHGFVLERWYPRPQLTLFMDAPPEVLVARKPGDSVERVRQRREDYLSLASVLPAFEVVDADRPLGEVVEDVVARIVAFEVARTAGVAAQPESERPEPDRPALPERPVDVEAHVAAARDAVDLRVVPSLDSSTPASGLR